MRNQDDDCGGAAAPSNGDGCGHFQTGGASYAKSRPGYPPELAAALAALAPARRMAIDVGCGSGQLTLPLAQHFAAVVGCDVSAEQLAAAPSDPRIRYELCGAGRLPVGDDAADLVCAAQAAHWFDLPPFYAEAQRVLAPGGIIALISYGPIVVEGPFGPRFARFYRDMAPLWPPERAHVENGYRQMPFPFPEQPMPELEIADTWPVSRLLGYVRSWSAARHSAAPALIAALERDAGAALPDDPLLRVRFPLSFRVGRAG